MAGVGFRFMYDKIEDKFNFLENRIRKHATALVASGLFEEPIDPTIASQGDDASVNWSFSNTASKPSAVTLPLMCASEYQNYPQSFRLPASSPYDNFLKAAGC